MAADGSAELAERSAATLAECGATILPNAIRSVAPGVHLAGRAVTVLTAPGQNLWLHRAIYEAEAGDILVVSTQGGHAFGYWGEVMARAAQVRGIAGLVIDGCVRDSAAIGQLGFPVFARGTCVRGTGKRPDGGGMRVPVALDGAVVFDGDVVVGDGDGVVAIPSHAIDDVLGRAAERDAAESRIFDAIATGHTTLDIYQLPTTNCPHRHEGATR